MSYDTSQRYDNDALFVGSGFTLNHTFYARRSNEQTGKQRMYASVEQMIKEHISPDRLMRFMSLPGRDWKFEHHIGQQFANWHHKKTFLTGFEDHYEVMLQGAQNVPRSDNYWELPSNPSWRKIERLGVDYFKTNQSRWLHLDINHALTLTPDHFPGDTTAEKAASWRWWMQKFCMWDAVWLDYCGTATDTMAKALNNLHIHCAPDRDEIPVAVTLLKGREQFRSQRTMQGFNALPDGDVLDRRKWLEYHLAGGCLYPNIRFKTLEYFEYRDTSPMCNILGLIQR